MLDVDGVLNPLGETASQTQRIRVEGEYGVWFLDKNDGEWLKTFQNQGARLLWQTTWEEEAVKYINPFYEIDDIDYVRYPVKTEGKDGLTYKLPRIKDNAGKHPLVVIDDDIKDDMRRWAQSREQPTLLIQTNPQQGWVEEDKQRISNFIESI